MRQRAERNAVIAHRVLRGDTCRHVAEAYGISGPRVLAITVAVFQRAYPRYRSRFDLGLARMRIIYHQCPFGQPPQA